MVRQKSKLWLSSATLIAGGAAVYAAAVTLYWRPCAGSMLNGSILRGYRYESEFTEDCLIAMDQAPGFHLPELGAGWTPIGSLGVVAALLLSAAWWVLLPALQVPKRTRLVAALPGVLGLVLLGLEVARSLNAATPGPIIPVIAVLVDLSVPIVVVALHRAGVTGLMLVRVTMVALAATVTGVVHQSAEYFVAIVLSDANWDTPPGSGHLTVTFLWLTASLTLVWWWLANGSTRVSSASRAGVG